MYIFTDSELDMLIAGVQRTLREWEATCATARVLPEQMAPMRLQYNVLKCKLYAEKARRVEPKVQCGSCCDHRCECLCHLFDEERATKEI